MSGDEFEQILSKQFKRLPYHRQIGFALWICKRLYPEYEYFQKKEQWGNASLLAEGIAFIEKHQVAQAFDVTQVQRLVESIDEVTPDMDDYGDYHGSYALNAAIVVMEALRFLADREVEHLLAISTYMTDTIDFKIHEANENKNDGSNWQHPRMQQEMNRQLEMTK
jgi:uncharacterized protein YjaG (DUF416 family)